MKSIHLGYVPVQFGDSSSSRGYGGTSGYGSSSVGSSYRGYDYPNRSTLSSYGGGIGSNSYDNYRTPSASDKTLNYLTSAGAVSSLKDKFDLSPSTGLRGSSTSGYASSSLDRYTGRNLGSDYTTTSSKVGSGYTSDVDLGGLGSQSYGGASYSSTWSQPTSYVPTSSRTSRSDYSRPSRDMGLSYGQSSISTGHSSGTDASRAKSSYYSLTPFETRRTAKASDLNLTPFTARVSGDSAKPSYDRQTSSSSTAGHDKSSAAGGVSRQLSNEETTRTTKARVVLPESSDSAEEPGDISKRDPNVRYLTSRATSPMEIDRDEFDKRKPEKNRNRLLSRTKTKTYPVGDRKRRRQLKNIHVQVDGEELDRYCGRVRINREKRPKSAAPENKYGIPRYGPSVTAIASIIDDKSSTPTKGSSSVGGGGGLGTSVSTGREEPKEKPGLPKQSGFVPRDRKTPRNNFRDEDDANDVPFSIMTKKDRERKEDVNEADKDQVPKQSSFLERKWHQQEEVEKQTKQEKAKQVSKAQKDKAATENLSLKESIEKVKSWKKQLQRAAPDSGDEDENHLEIYGKDDWSKKKNLKNKSTNETSKDVTLSPPRSVRSPSGSDKSEVGFLRDSSPNVEVSESLPKEKRKMVAGVPKFPLTTKNIIDDEKQNRKQKQKANKDRSPSPYDNLKGPGTTNQRSISSYDNLENAGGGQTGKLPLGKAFPSTDSLGGFGGDVSSEDDDKRGMSSKGHRSATLLKPKVQLGSSTTSLPDLVTSSEVVRRGVFIGKLRDIDNLLGFSETEDDTKQLSKSESESSDEDSSDESSTNNRNNNSNNKRPVVRSGAKIVLSPVSEGKSSNSSNKRKSVSPLPRPSNDVTLVGDSEDIDEILDADLVSKFLGSVTPSTTPDSAHVVTSPLLRLDITPPQIDLSSSESLLDTPVPDTPDVPLSPVPAFFAAKDSRKAQSMDQLNRQTDQIGRPLQMKSQDRSKQQQHPASPPDRTKSFGDLDDVGSPMTVTNSTPRISGKRDNAQHAKVEHQTEVRHQRPVHRQTTVDGIPIETLVDLSFDDKTDAASAAPQEMMTPVAKRFYPPGYSDKVVKEAIARHESNGQVIISELVEICKKPLKRKPPWVEDEEDRRFAGYKDVGEALENMEVDIKKLHDCAVALYRHVGRGRSRAAYLQPQTSIDNNSSDEDGATENQMTDSLKHKIHVTVGVHAFIDKLIHSSGQELRRALFSLKQILKNDKDVVREFIYSDGLTCLVKIGTEANHSYQSYILRGLGQLMLYVDGMNGIVADNIAIQWLYMLTTSKCYPVAKTSLRLLQMFLDYSDCNAFLLLQAVSVVSHSKGLKMWSYLLDFIKQSENAGQGDLSIEAMTLLNKVLSAIPDQDTFYDMTDALEDQDLEKTMQSQMKRKGTKQELLEQFRIYDVMIREEDAQENMQVDLIENISFQKTRRIKSKTPGRRSVRYARISSSQASKNKNKNDSKQREMDMKSVGASQMSAQFREPMKFKWRREYDEEEEEPIWSALSKNEQQKQSAAPAEPAPARHILRLGGEGNKGSGQGLDDFPTSPPSDAGGRRCFVYKMSKQPSSGGNERESSKSGNKAQGAVLDNQVPVHMLADKMSSGQQDGRKGVQSSQPEGDFTGLICKAKDGLSSGSRQSFVRKVEPEEEKPPEKSEAEQRWEEIEKKMLRALKINEMDFTDLTEVDEINYLNAQPAGGVPTIQPLGLPPPHRKLPSPTGLPPPAPPPPPAFKPPAPPPPPMMGMPPPPPPPVGAPPGAPDKGRKTIRLHWKEAKSEFFTPSGRSNDTVWSKISRELGPVKINKESYLELFESKASDLKIKQKEGSKKELTILDAKRSNAINIGLTSLPPPRAIKTAILKMDNAVMNRESIEKILHTMLPTEEEKTKIMEVQMSQPDTPLGTAEQFLLTLSSITELEARLSLWAFTIDYETVEAEISEPLSDLRMAMEELRRSRTFKYVLGTLLSVGNCLNNTQAKGFTLEILSRVPEVKDTVQKHSLLQHLVQMITEQFSDSNDLFSDLGAVNRCAKVDWDELEEKLSRMETGCKASWDHLRAVVKHDSNTALKTKLSDSLADFAERIIVLKIIYRRILNRFHRFLLYLGYQAPDVSQVKVNAFCKTIIEFALEYRTVRDKLIQSKQKKDSHQHKERRSSRAKISASEENLSKGFKKSVDMDDAYNRRSGQQSADKQLNFLDGVKLTKCPSLSKLSGHVSETDSVCDTGDEDILEAVMRTASASSERRRDKRKTKDSDSKSWRSYGNTRDRYVY